jgi:hypothetical protein
MKVCQMVVEVLLRGEKVADLRETGRVWSVI